MQADGNGTVFGLVTERKLSKPGDIFRYKSWN